MKKYDKVYKIEIEYGENNDGNSKMMEVTVDGGDGPMPIGLRSWIARNYFDEMFHRDEYKRN